MLHVPFSPRDFAPPLLSGAGIIELIEFVMLSLLMLESGALAMPFVPFEETLSAITEIETSAETPRTAIQRDFIFMGIFPFYPGTVVSLCGRWGRRETLPIRQYRDFSCGLSAVRLV